MKKTKRNLARGRKKKNATHRDGRNLLAGVNSHRDLRKHGIRKKH